MPFPSLFLLAGLIFLWRRAERRGKPWPAGLIALGVVLALAFPVLWALAFDFVTPLAVLALIVWAASAGHSRARGEARQARAVRKALKRVRRAARKGEDLSALLREVERLRGRFGSAPAQDAPIADEGGDAARAVEQLIRKHERDLPQDVVLRLRELHGRVREADSYLRERGLTEAEPGRRLHLIAADYLPDALRAYLRLPRHLAASAPLFEGKTGQAVLLEQVEVLSRGVETLLAGVAQAEGQALLAHGRFLETKFETKRPEFDV